MESASLHVSEVRATPVTVIRAALLPGLSPIEPEFCRLTDVVVHPFPITSRLGPLAVGDEARDIEAARGAGMLSVAVAWGFQDPDTLAAHDPDVLVTAPSELAVAINSLGRPDD